MSHNFYPLDEVALDEMCKKVPIKDNKAVKLLLGFASSLATDADTERLVSLSRHLLGFRQCKLFPSLL